MLTHISPYSKAEYGGEILNLAWIDRGTLAELSYGLWLTTKAKRWFDPFEYSRDCKRNQVYYVDVLPPASHPTECRKPVFISEARYEAVPQACGFYQASLIEFLYLCLELKSEVACSRPILVTGGKKDNIFLLENGKVAVVHWLSGYNRWQLHVTDDAPYMIDSGTRIFALR